MRALRVSVAAVVSECAGNSIAVLDGQSGDDAYSYRGVTCGTQPLEACYSEFASRFFVIDYFGNGVIIKVRVSHAGRFDQVTAAGSREARAPCALLRHPYHIYPTRKALPVILYFTGSGNSKFVADLIAHVVGDQTLSLNDAVKSGKPLSATSDKPYVIVTSIYAFDLPHVVMRAVFEATLSGSGEAYVVATCSDRSANAHRSARKLIDGKGMTFLGFYDVVMPDNTVTMFDMPNAAAIRAKIAEALPGLVEAAGKIAKGEPVSGACKGPGFLTIINGMMIKRMENAKGCSYSSVKRNSPFRRAFLAMLTQVVRLRTEPCPS